MDLFLLIIMSLLFDNLTALPDIEHRSMKTVSSNSIGTSERVTEASSNDLVTSDTYGFAYYPQYYATNLNNPNMASNGFGQNNNVASNIPKTSKDTATSGTSAGTGNNADTGVGPFNGIFTSAATIQLLATPIYAARLNIVPYEIMPIRVRPLPKYDNGQLSKMNGQSLFDRRSNNSLDKHYAMSNGNGGANGYANANDSRYGGGYGTATADNNGNGNGNGNVNGNGYGYGYGYGYGNANGNKGGHIGGILYKDLYHQNGRRYIVF